MSRRSDFKFRLSVYNVKSSASTQDATSSFASMPKLEVSDGASPVKRNDQVRSPEDEAFFMNHMNYPTLQALPGVSFVVGPKGLRESLRTEGVSHLCNIPYGAIRIVFFGHVESSQHCRILNFELWEYAILQALAGLDCSIVPCASYLLKSSNDSASYRPPIYDGRIYLNRIKAEHVGADPRTFDQMSDDQKYDQVTALFKSLEATMGVSADSETNKKYKMLTGVDHPSVMSKRSLKQPLQPHSGEEFLSEIIKDDDSTLSLSTSKGSDVSSVF